MGRGPVLSSKAVKGSGNPFPHEVGSSSPQNTHHMKQQFRSSGADEAVETAVMPSGDTDGCVWLCNIRAVCVSVIGVSVCCRTARWLRGAGGGARIKKDESQRGAAETDGRGDTWLQIQMWSDAGGTSAHVSRCVRLNYEDGSMWTARRLQGCCNTSCLIRL